MNDPRDYTAAPFGCGTKILLGGFALGAFAMVVLIALSFIVPRAVDRAVETYTDTAPAPLRTEPVPEPERKEIQQKVDDYSDALDKHEAKEPLVLTDREVNALLAKELEKEGELAAGIEFRPGQIRAQVSLRLTQTLPLGPWSRDLTGRYLNGTATFDASVRNGQLNLYLTGFDVKGHALPERALAILRDEIDKSGALAGDDVQDFLKKVSAVEFESGKVTITPR
jgi:hypothetical protein